MDGKNIRLIRRRSDFSRQVPKHANWQPRLSSFAGDIPSFGFGSAAQDSQESKRTDSSSHAPRNDNHWYALAQPPVNPCQRLRTCEERLYRAVFHVHFDR